MTNAPYSEAESQTGKEAVVAAVQSPPPVEPQKLPSRGINPLRSLAAHRFLAAGIIFVIVGVIGPPFVYLKGKHYFQTEASIYIAPRFAKNLEQDQELVFESNSQYREFVQQQVRSINRFDIVFSALQKLGERRFLWQNRNEPDRIAAERLQGELEVKPVADTYQITVGLEGKKSEGLDEIVNAVVDSYIAVFKSEELYGTGQRLEALEIERNKILEEIEAKTARRTQLAQELAVTTFNDSNPNPYDQLLLNANQAFALARHQRLEAEAQLASLDSAQRSEGSDALASMAADLASRDPGLTSLKANLNQRRAELLTRRSGLGEQHLGRISIDQEITEIDAEIRRMTNSLVAGFSQMLLDQKRADVYKQQQVEAKLVTALQEQTQKAASFATGFQEAIACGKDNERLRKRLDAIDDRVGFLGLEKRAPGFIRVFAKARAPMVPSKSGHKRLAIVIVIAGFALGILIPIVVDFLDPNVHVVNDLQNILGFAPAGWIPERQEGSELIGLDCRMRLAGALLREKRIKGNSIFLLTGVRPGSGTTTIALDLADEIARLGDKAIIVEANAFHPDSRLGSKPGLNEILAGSVSAGATILDGDGGPTRIPVGSPGQERRLANIGQISKVMNALRAQYSIVLIDAAPLLLSADTEHLVSIANATLLIAEAEAVTKAEIQRAARLLEKLSPGAAGAVLNRVRGFGTAGDHSELVKEYRTAAKARPSVLASPWLWK